MVVAFGADYSHARPTPAQLQKYGIKFVCRYLLDDARDQGKALKLAEARALTACGCDIVANFEYATRPTLTRHQGEADAWTSLAELRALGAPSNRPVYFSFDYDVQPGEYGGVLAYLRGAESVLGAGLAGAYGHYGLVEYLARNGIRWLWQTYAWSHGAWSTHATVRQVHNGAFAEFDGDLNHAMVPDYGQWTLNQLEDDMATFTDEHARKLEEVWRLLYEGKRLNDPQTAGGGVPIAWVVRTAAQLGADVEQVYGEVDSLEETDTQILAAVEAIQAGDPNALADAIVAKLGPAQAQATLDALYNRLAG